MEFPAQVADWESGLWRRARGAGIGQRGKSLRKGGVS